MELPAGYTPPVPVYIVEEPDPDAEVAQVGAFFDEKEARALLDRLVAEGRRARINVIPVHRRLADHEHDR